MAGCGLSDGCQGWNEEHERQARVGGRHRHRRYIHRCDRGQSGDRRAADRQGCIDATHLLRRRDQRLGARRHSRRGDALVPPRRHGLHQRHSRAQRRQDRADHHRGLSRRARRRPRRAHFRFRARLGSARTDRAAAQRAGGARARQSIRRDRHAARGGRRAARGADDQKAQHRVGRRGVHGFVHESGARTAHARNPASGAARYRHHAIARSAAADARIRAHLHDGAQCLCVADPQELPERPRRSSEDRLGL